MMTLRSRYGDTWVLEETEFGYTWKIPDFTRFGLFPDSLTDISFVDPPGGPFLEVGGLLREGEIITSIQEGEEPGTILIYTHKREG